jgi:hypothetical protein
MAQGGLQVSERPVELVEAPHVRADGAGDLSRGKAAPASRQRSESAGRQRSEERTGGPRSSDPTPPQDV